MRVPELHDSHKNIDINANYKGDENGSIYMVRTGVVSQTPGFSENSRLKQEEEGKEEDEKVELLLLSAGVGNQAERIMAGLDWSPGV